MGRMVYLPIHEWLIFYGFHVGGYTSPMVPSWVSTTPLEHTPKPLGKQKKIPFIVGESWGLGGLGSDIGGVLQLSAFYLDFPVKYRGIPCDFLILWHPV